MIIDLGGVYHCSRYCKLKCKIRVAQFIFSESPPPGRIQLPCILAGAEYYFVLVAGQSKQQFC